MKKSILVLAFLCCCFVALFLITRQSNKLLSSKWEELNNFNPITNSFKNVIDSIGKEGRHTLIRLDNGNQFLIYIYTAPGEIENELSFRVGDTMIHNVNSKKYKVNTKNGEVIEFKINNNKEDYYEEGL